MLCPSPQGFLIPGAQRGTLYRREEKRERVDVDADYPSTRGNRLDNRCAAAHERVKDNTPFSGELEDDGPSKFRRKTRWIVVEIVGQADHRFAGIEGG